MKTKGNLTTAELLQKETASVYDRRANSMLEYIKLGVVNDYNNIDSLEAVITAANNVLDVYDDTEEIVPFTEEDNKVISAMKRVIESFTNMIEELHIRMMVFE